MEVIELLKKDHRAVEALFERFDDGGGLTGMVKRLTGSGASSRQRRSVAERICEQLDVHARIEEQVFYPAVRALRDEALSTLVGESAREHATIKERVAAARSSVADEEELRSAMRALQECVDHHVREEENEMFPLLEQRMPTARRAELGRELAARKRATAPRVRKTTARAKAGSKRRVRKTTARARKTSTRTTKRASGSRRR